MTKPLEKFLLFRDKHHRAILNINLTLFTMASVMLFIFHTEKNGFPEASISYDLIITVFPLLIFLSGYNQSKKSNESNKRILTYIFIMYLTA